jgi:hypothetical protein
MTLLSYQHHLKFPQNINLTSSREYIVSKALLIAFGVKFR